MKAILFCLLFTLPLFAEETPVSKEKTDAETALRDKAIKIAKAEAEKHKFDLSSIKGSHWKYDVSKTENGGWFVTINLVSDERGVIPGGPIINIDKNWSVTHYEVSK